MRQFGISSSRFEALERDLMKKKTFKIMIGREMEAKITKKKEFTLKLVFEQNFIPNKLSV